MLLLHITNLANLESGASSSVTVEPPSGAEDLRLEYCSKHL